MDLLTIFTYLALGFIGIIALIFLILLVVVLVMACKIAYKKIMEDENAEKDTDA